MTHATVSLSAQIHKSTERWHLTTCTRVPWCLAGWGLWGQCCVSLSEHLWNLSIPGFISRSGSLLSFFSAGVMLCHSLWYFCFLITRPTNNKHHDEHGRRKIKCSQDEQIKAADHILSQLDVCAKTRTYQSYPVNMTTNLNIFKGTNI